MHSLRIENLSESDLRSCCKESPEKKFCGFDESLILCGDDFMKLPLLYAKKNARR